MIFRTQLSPLPGHDTLINHDSTIAMLGSCFTDNVSTLLEREGFNVVANPCGTLYNPASIATTIIDALYRRPITEADIFQGPDGLWHSYGFHTRLSAATAEEALKGMNAAVTELADALETAGTLIITFGSSWLWRLADDSRRVVANCHKMPPATFTREMLTQQQTTGLWKKIIRELWARNPNLTIIFTVSPIRHIAPDGLHANQLSKASLLLAIDRIISELDSQGQRLIYFPAYEALVDDLRDYRFYAADMVHPSEVAVEYLYRELFRPSFMTAAVCAEADSRMRQWRRQAHRSLTNK